MLQESPATAGNLLELWLLLCGLGDGEGGEQVTWGRVRMQIISWCGLKPCGRGLGQSCEEVLAEGSDDALVKKVH